MGSCLAGEGPAGAGLPHGTGSSAAGRRKDRRKHRRTGSSSSSQRLHRVPGRMCINGCSDTASIFTKQGKKGVNQDAMIVWENFGSKADTTFCGVFDGHGPCGHLVAKKVRDSLPLKLKYLWESISSSKNGLVGGSTGALGSLKSEEFASAPSPAHCDKQTEILLTWKDLFRKAFWVMDKELRLHPHIDCYCSGTTAVTLVKQGQDLVIGNIGDSRAVMGTRDKDNSLVAVQLTIDLKPSVPGEAERIRLCKGRVFPLKSEPEVARVWLPYIDSPGLAMARAFGDFCLKNFGLISDPDVSYYRLSEKDEFVILATDGIWDVLTNEEVVNIVASAPRATAAKALVESAVRVWRFKYPSSKVDDCAVVCLFLNPGSPNASISTADQKITVQDMLNSDSNKDASALVSIDHSEKTSRKPSEAFITKSE